MIKHRAIKLAIAFYLCALPAVSRDIPSDLAVHAKMIIPEMKGAPAFSPVSAERLGWMVYPQNTVIYVMSVIRDGDKTKMEILFFTLRNGRFYNEFFSGFGLDKTAGKIRSEIMELEKMLAQDNFPSPKHRYGAEAALAHLRNQLKPPPFSAVFICVAGDYLVFSAPDYGKASYRISHSDAGASKKYIAAPGGDPVLYEGMGRAYYISGDTVRISGLPYAHVRNYPVEIFRGDPGIRTVIIDSFDAHSMGKSGIQIDNR